MINSYRKNVSGFTLIELLVTMALTLIVVGAMYNILDSANRNYAVQDEKVEAQNNLRAAVGLLTHELRMAGYDSTGTANAGFENTTDADEIHFTMDITDSADVDGDGDFDDGDGDVADPDEDVAYTLADGDGDSDTDLLRNGFILAENIQAIEFYYNDTSTTAPTPLSDIRSVTVSILAITAHKDSRFSGGQTFTPASIPDDDWETPDGYRGSFATFTVKCRNMGL